MQVTSKAFHAHSPFIQLRPSATFVQQSHPCVHPLHEDQLHQHVQRRWWWRLPCQSGTIQAPAAALHSLLPLYLFQLTFAQQVHTHRQLVEQVCIRTYHFLQRCHMGWLHFWFYDVGDFLRRYSRSVENKQRSKRQAPAPNGATQLCPTTSAYIMPRAALNNKGNWMYVVNLNEVDDKYTQLVRSESCA